MSTTYGFYTEKFSEDLEIETLKTGDGKSQFTDLVYDDGTVAIGISYGVGEGIGVKVEHNKRLDETLKIKWQVKFESQASIDSMIETLLRVKNNLKR